MQFAKARSFILSLLKKDLPPHFSYHSVSHILDVFESAERLAKSEHIAGEELKLLLTAALYHDSGFLLRHTRHEEASCHLARKYLPRFNYTGAQIKAICEMIMATKLPQQPLSRAQEILCDADLDYLGRKDYYRISAYLLSELKVYGMIHDEKEWLQLQIKFFESHCYFTATAIKLRIKTKEKHLRELRQKAATL